MKHNYNFSEYYHEVVENAISILDKHESFVELNEIMEEVTSRKILWNQDKMYFA